MKRFKFLVIVLFVLFVLFSANSFGDIIITSPNSARINVRINNLNDFPDVAVVGLIDCVALSKSNMVYKVESGDFLMLHRSCPVSLYVMKATYLEDVDLNKIDWAKDKNVKKMNLTINGNTFNSKDYSSLFIDYNLACYKDTTFYLYKTMTTYISRNKQQDLVQSFKNDVDPFKPISVSAKNAF